MNFKAVNTEIYTEDDLKDLIAEHVGPSRVPRKLKITTDTSDFFRVDYDDVVILENHPYLIRNYKREGRFGIGDQPKFWVKSAIDLLSGEQKIIKMVFHEKFVSTVGDITFDCVRSPRKEARILALVKGHRHFMQGFGIRDEAGNIIRVIDCIHGRFMEDIILDLGTNHEDYFFTHFPDVLRQYISLVKAIKFLHDHGEKHGDIRRDHIMMDRDSGTYRWIDFDFNYWHRENMFGYDLFGLGNILVYLVGRGDVTTQDLKKFNSKGFGQLSTDDLNIIFHNRVVNLKKIYPYIPDVLNLILLHFSIGAHIFYNDTSQLLHDLEETAELLCSPITRQ